MRYDQVDKAIAAGKLWRAKEILEGRLRTPDFDRELLLRYGKVLMAMGDPIAAGRMLYFSGNRDVEFREAINLFLSRHPRTVPRRFLSRMPLMVRRQAHLADYLASEEFAASGWSASALQSIEPRSVPIRRERLSPFRRRLQNFVGATVAFTIFALLLVGLGVGVISVGRFVFAVFR